MGCLFLKIWKVRSDEKQLVSQFTISQTTKIALTGAVDILSALLYSCQYLYQVLAA